MQICENNNVSIKVLTIILVLSFVVASKPVVVNIYQSKTLLVRKETQVNQFCNESECHCCSHQTDLSNQFSRYCICLSTHEIYKDSYSLLDTIKIYSCIKQVITETPGVDSVNRRNSSLEENATSEHYQSIRTETSAILII